MDEHAKGSTSDSSHAPSCAKPAACADADSQPPGEAAGAADEGEQPNARNRLQIAASMLILELAARADAHALLALRDMCDQALADLLDK